MKERIGGGGVKQDSDRDWILVRLGDNDDMLEKDNGLVRLDMVMLEKDNGLGDNDDMLEKDNVFS